MPAGRVSKEMVRSEATFLMYCRQVMGIQPPTGKDIGAARKIINEIWAYHPHVEGDYYLLSDIPDWASARKKRPQTIAGLLGNWRYAVNNGYLRDLDPKISEGKMIQKELSQILTLEADQEWVQQLNWAASRGLDTWEKIVIEWEQERLPLIRKDQ